MNLFVEVARAGLSDQLATADRYISHIGRRIDPLRNPENGFGREHDATKGDVAIDLVQRRQSPARLDVLPLKRCRVVDRVSVAFPYFDKRLERLIIAILCAIRAKPNDAIKPIP